MTTVLMGQNIDTMHSKPNQLGHTPELTRCLEFGHIVYIFFRMFLFLIHDSLITEHYQFPV
jgi:hypothetical protein